MNMNKKCKTIGLSLCCAVTIAAIAGGTFVYAAQSTGNYIGEEEAKAIALEHAGITEDEASFISCRLDSDDRTVEYDVDFWDGNTEYDYEIDATTGEIRSYDIDHNNRIANSQTAGSNTDTPSSDEEYITAEQAQTIALEDAQMNADDVSRLECKFDYDDGRAEYEVEWEVGRTDYEYTILAVDGSIIERDVD